MLRIMNTMTHSLEPFEPKEARHVRMYVCGPSVYDESHLGHARSYVIYDAMKRHFLETGNRVTHVQNFTDVEENITKRAAEHGMEPLEWASTLIQHFFDDMDRLRILRATHYPRVSENIDRIVQIVDDLERSGVAYCVDCRPADGAPREGVPSHACDVYFSAERAPDYGAMIGQNLEELTVDRPMQAGERRNPLDFALWKSRNDWGVTWPSRFGEGRPGWHVECAAMATKHLGMAFDIHGGGLDLVFPHHESERVIAEAWKGGRYCRYYVHNGFVTVGDQKMSKSLGNFVTVRDLLARHDPEVLRTFLLSEHYRAPLNYDAAAIERAAKRVAQWRAHVEATRREAEGHEPASAPPEGVAKARDAFRAAIEDDFQFGRALDALDAATAAAALARGGEAAASFAFLQEAARTLGLLWSLDTAPSQ